MCVCSLPTIPHALGGKGGETRVACVCIDQFEADDTPATDTSALQRSVECDQVTRSGVTDEWTPADEPGCAVGSLVSEVPGAPPEL